MKRIVMLGVGLVIAGMAVMAAAQPAPFESPGGNPAKRSCAFEAPSPPSPSSGPAAPALTSRAEPPPAANEAVGPTATGEHTSVRDAGNYYPGPVATAKEVRTAKPGRVFVSTSDPTNVGVQC